MKMSSRKNTEFLAEGTLVEVTSDEEGFCGAWYPAKVLETPTKKMKCLVEYQSLLFPDSNELLRELVPSKFVRPLPPPPSSSEGEQRFQVHDVVEAYHNDGWWVGVVSEVSKEDQPRIYSVSFENPYDHVMEFESSQLRFHLDWDGHKWVQPQKPKKTIGKGQVKRKEMREVQTSSQKRKRGKHVKSLPKGKECDAAEGGVDEIFVKNSSTIGVESAIMGDSTAEKVTELSDTGSNVKDDDMANMLSQGVDVDEDESMCSPAIVVDSKAAIVDDMPFENPNLQYLESSPVLKVVQSMEEFQLMPQKPHFRPLDKCEEVRREGLMLAYMITFVNVVKETSKLQADSSGSMIDSLFECLSELESHGFDVKNVRSRLLKLQSMKATQEELQTKLEKVECEITSWTCNASKMKEELDDAMNEMKMLEEKIKVAEEKRSRLTLMNEENDSVIAKLKSSDDLLNEDIQKVEHNFASLAASPWR